MTTQRIVATWDFETVQGGPFSLHLFEDERGVARFDGSFKGVAVDDLTADALRQLRAVLDAAILRCDQPGGPRPIFAAV